MASIDTSLSAVLSSNKLTASAAVASQPSATSVSSGSSFGNAYTVALSSTAQAIQYAGIREYPGGASLAGASGSGSLNLPPNPNVKPYATPTNINGSSASGSGSLNLPPNPNVKPYATPTNINGSSGSGSAGAANQASPPPPPAQSPSGSSGAKSAPVPVTSSSTSSTTTEELVKEATQQAALKIGYSEAADVVDKQGDIEQGKLQEIENQQAAQAALQQQFSQSAPAASASAQTINLVV